MFYLMTRKLIKNSEFIMERERKKRMMPRHILSSAIVSGFMPMNKVSKEPLTI